MTFASRWKLSDQRIRTKLTLILVVPLLAIVTLAGLNVASTTSASTSAERARQLVVLGTRAAELAECVQRERVAAVLVFAAGAAATGPIDDYRERINASDAAIDRFRDQRRRTSAPEMFQPSLTRIDADFGDLRSVRPQVLSSPDAGASAVAARYQLVVADLLRLRQLLPQMQAVTQIAARLRATASLGDAAEALGRVQTAMVRAWAAGRITSVTQREIISADIGFSESLAEFRRLAPETWISRYNSVVTGAEVRGAERMYDVVSRAQPGKLPSLGTDADGWVSAVHAWTRLLHRLESELDAQLVVEIEEQRDAARRDVGLTIGAVCVAILGIIAFGAAVARSLTRSLTGLSAAAEAVAHTRLPEMVDRIGSGAADSDETRRLVAGIAEPIPVFGGDEVGQVAAAFNAVTASAVRLAGEQAALQGGVRAIFNSLSRRSQRRLNTVMASIDSLQAKEADPDQLTLLFRLDHAATGLRRLTAGLQVLAGGRAGLVRPEPMPLSDVLRAAQSEIDQYQRIDIGTVDDDVRLYGETVEEVIHLLAELLDNAARFSAPDTLVVIDGRRVGDRLHLQITDAGKGMTEAQLAAARDRLAHPHRLDQQAAQQMGLPVVSAIADRLQITVELRPAEPHGTRVDLTLPPALFRTESAGSPEPGAGELPAPGDTAWSNCPTIEVPALAATQPGVPAGPVPAGQPGASAQPGSGVESLPLPTSVHRMPAPGAPAPEVPGVPTLGVPAAWAPDQGQEEGGGAEPLLPVSGWPSALSWQSPAHDETVPPQPVPSRPAQPAPAVPSLPAVSPLPSASAVPSLPGEPMRAVPLLSAVSPLPSASAVPSLPGEAGSAAGPAAAMGEPMPEIYQQLKHAWFGGDAAARPWVAGGQDAAASEVDEYTPTGLPRRRKGATIRPAAADPADPATAPPPPGWPPPASPGTRPATAQPQPPRQPAAQPAASPAASPADQRRGRDPEQLRRRYAGLDRALSTARRRSESRPPQEEQQR